MNIVKVQPKPKRRGFIKGTRPGWKKAIVQLREGDDDRDLRRGAGLDGAQEVQADEPGPPLHDASRPSRRSRSPSRRRALTRAAEEEGRPQQPRPHHDAPPGRRPQAPLPHDRLQAHEGRRAGEGRRDRVRPEPVGADRAAPLRRRREGVHPRARRGCASARPSSPGPTADIKPGNALPLAEHPDRHARPQRRAEAGPGRARWRARPAPASSSSRRTSGYARPAAALRRDAPRAAHLPRHRRPGREHRPREPVRAARPAAAAGSASARPCAARR